MNVIPFRARVYLFLVVFLGVSSLYLSLTTPHVRNFSWVALLLFLLLSLFLERQPLPTTWQISTSLARGLYLAAILIFGKEAAFTLVLASGTLSEIAMGRAWYKGLFNLSQTVVAVALAGFFFDTHYRGGFLLAPWQNLVASLGCALTFAISGPFLLFTMVSLAEELPLARVVKQHWKTSSLQMIISSGLALTIALLYLEHPLSLPLLLLPFVILHYTIKVHSSNQELNQRLQELAILFKSSHILSTSLSWRDILQVLIQMVQELIKSERVNVYLFDHGGNPAATSSLVLKATSFDPSFDGDLRWEYLEEISTWLPSKGQGAVVADRAEDLWRSIKPDPAPSAKILEELHKDQRSGLFIPLFFAETQLGILEVTHSLPKLYSQEDLRNLSILANVASGSLKNALLYEDTLQLAIKDGLTGLFNYRLLQDLLEKELARASREKFDVTLILVDVDHFKDFNDRHGHQVGDQVLKRVALCILSAVREGDMVARYGGEEFAVVLPYTTKEKAWEVAERIRTGIEQNMLILPGGEETKVTVSLGIASFPRDARNKFQLVEMADLALYQAKESGRNMTFTYSRSYVVEEKLLTALEGISGSSFELVQRNFALQVASFLANLIDSRDAYSKGHSNLVASWCVKVGKELGMNGASLDTLHVAALLHDVGKIGVAEQILHKQGPLTPEERDQVKKHLEIGKDLLGWAPGGPGFFQRVSQLVYQHEERYNGAGYPMGLKGEQIHLGARIIAVVSAYFSMTTDRPFRKALLQEEAIAELTKAAGTQYDPAVVDSFLSLLRKEDSRPRTLPVNP